LQRNAREAIEVALDLENRYRRVGKPKYVCTAFAEDHLLANGRSSILIEKLSDECVSDVAFGDSRRRQTRWGVNRAHTHIVSNARAQVTT
jgi:hypothetical protein